MSKTLQEILEIIKFNLTIQQQEAIEKALGDLEEAAYKNGYDNGYDKGADTIPWGNGIN